MTSNVNRQITLAERPVGHPTQADFRLVESSLPQLGEGGVLIRAVWLSLDPYQRGRMRSGASYAAPLELGEVITGGVVGRVTASRTPAFSVGDVVEGPLGWQEYGLSDGRNLRKVDTSMGPLSTALGVLGMPGMTAYFGLREAAGAMGLGQCRGSSQTPRDDAGRGLRRRQGGRQDSCHQAEGAVQAYLPDGHDEGGVGDRPSPRADRRRR